MKFSKIRKFILNAVTRGRISSIANEIESSFRSNNNSDEHLKLREIQFYATQNVPFYTEYGNDSFSDLPVVDKRMIQSDLLSFVDRGVDISKLAAASTSGSTGTPFTVYFNEDKLLRRRAGVIANYKFMNVDPYGELIYARAWKRLSFAAKIILSLKGQFPFDGKQHPPQEYRRVADWSTKNRPVILMGYSSVVEGLLRGLEAMDEPIGPDVVSGVLGCSESSSPYLIEASQRLFGIYPRMRYSNMEMGIIAVTGEDIDVYHIDCSSFYVEILKEDSNDPALPGESGRIVVTDLHNTAMPLLRYDTGDAGQFVVEQSGEIDRSRITNIHGRRLDVIIGGTVEAPKKLHAMQVFVGSTSKIRELKEFQLRQHGIGRFTWVLNASKNSNIERSLRQILEEEVNYIEECNFIYTEDIPLSRSGKRRFFVNEMLENGDCEL